jgi:hypothetical protein
LLLISLISSAYFGVMQDFDYSNRPLKVAGEWIRSQKSKRGRRHGRQACSVRGYFAIGRLNP